ncbi:MAG: hydroxymethylbilane synthase [Phycisphaerales bacterium]|nr:hydroxymethylbilane synthase [Phycisphaerales bacterium]
MKRTSLILAAHGGGDGSAANLHIEACARQLAATGRFDEVFAAVRLGSPSWQEALELTEGDEVVVVPFMTSEGYFCRVALPDALGASALKAGRKVRITPPVGTHPGVTAIAAARLSDLVDRYALDPEKTVAILCGHGTPRHPESRRAAVNLALRLARRRLCVSCIPAYLEEDLRIEDAPRRLRGYHLVVLPFLIGGAFHAMHDIPRRLGLAPADAAEGEAGGVGGGVNFPLARRDQDRWMLCDDALGRQAGFVEVILERACDAVEAGGGEDLEGGVTGCKRPSDHRLESRCPRESGSRAAARRSASASAWLESGPRRLRLGTRASALALWQANHAAMLLREAGADVEVVELSTSGDRDLSRAIAELPGDAPFTDDLDDALRRGEIDVAVHALKDVPLNLPADLELAAVLPRGEVTESLVSRDGLRLQELPAGARVGTSSPRRRAQLLAVRADLEPAILRGPVDARVRQVREGRFDAAILASAGLMRLGLEHEIAERLSLDEFLPAPGQGALVIAVRKGDDALAARVRALDDAATRAAVTVELEFLRSFDGEDGVVAAAWAMCATQSGCREALLLRARLLTLGGLRLWDGCVKGADSCAVARSATRRARRAVASAQGAGLVQEVAASREVASV